MVLDGKNDSPKWTKLRVKRPLKWRGASPESASGSSSPRPRVYVTAVDPLEKPSTGLERGRVERPESLTPAKEIIRAGVSLSSGHGALR